jgi:23S rRNA G2445 N2-methylase RlmL
MEPLLVSELRSMGFQSIKMSRRGVYIKDLKDNNELLQSIYKVNYLSRIGTSFTSNSLIQKVYESYIPSSDSNLKTEKIFTKPSNVILNGVDSYQTQAHLQSTATLTQNAQVTAIHCVTLNFLALQNSHYASQLMKDAIVDQMRDVSGDRSNIDRDNPDVQLHLVMGGDQNFATISYDTSKNPLNMRQYRVKTGLEATLRETIASGIVQMALENFQGKPVIYDPCVGSGTLLIEAAMLLTKFEIKNVINIYKQHSKWLS